MPIKKEKLDSIKGYREYQNKQGRAADTGNSAPASISPTASNKKATIKPEKRKEIYTYYRTIAAPAKVSSPMFRTQQNAITPKNQSALAQDLAKGALQQQDAKNYQSKEAFEQHAQEVKAPTVAQRVGNTLKGAAKTYGAGLVNLSGMAQTGSGLQRREEANTEIALWDQDIKAQQDVLADPMSTESERDTARNVITALEARKAAYLQAYGEGGEVERMAQNIYKTADKLADSGTRDIERAKKDLGSVGRLAVDVGVAGAQMGADAALGLLTGGSALPAMFVRSTGGSAQEARRAGATHEQQVNYGFASGALSVATEKIGNAAAPFKKMFGKGFLDDVIERATQNLTRSAAGEIALSFLEEGGEEVLEDLIQPALQTIYNGKTMGGSYSELEAAEVLNDFLVGGILGGLGGAVEAVQRRGYYDSGTKLPDAEADRQPAFQEGVNRQVQRAQTQETAPETTPQEAEAQQSAAPERVIVQPAAAPENAPQQVTGKLETAAALAAAAQEGVPQQVSSTESIQAAEADNNMIGVENNAGPQTQYEPGGAEPAEAGEGGILSGGDGGRDAGTRAGEQAGVVEGSGSQRAPERSRTAIERQNLARDLRLEKVSSAELGIRQGTDAKSVTVLPENIWDAELQETAQRIRRETGKKTTMVLGTIPIATRDGVTRVRGVWASDGIIIQADNLRVSPGQIASHEIFHEFADQNPGLIQAVERSIREKYGDQEFDRIVESYIRNLRGIIDIDENAAEYEVEQALLDVKNEILADAYADINAFGQNAGKYREEVRQTLRERGITDSGSETAAATERRTGPPERYSIGEIEGKEQDYGDGVILDTNIFAGVRPREWGKVLSQYVYQNMAGTELTAYDAAGAPETIYLARANDRVRKDGAKNSHKVIDKLARSTGDNIRSLAVVHLDEALATSNYKNSTDENSHQWMDENGWEYRKTYLQDRSGNIYEATLNIADGRDRKILYDINNIRLIDKAKSPDKHTAVEAKAGETAGGVVPSTASGGARSTSRSVSENRIADRGGNVKPRTFSEEIMHQLTGGDTENKPDMANAGPNTVGAVTNNSQSLGGSAPAISSASGNSTPGSGGNVKPKQRFSISDELDGELQDVLDGSFPARNNEVYVGETSNFLTDVIGADALTVTMPANKAYSAMVTEEQAKADGKYREGTNYHGLGKQGLIDALDASESPVAAFADTTGAKGKRSDRIVLVTDMIHNGENVAVVEELNANGHIGGERIEANKIITSYNRAALADDIIAAAADGRLLYADKKRSQALTAGARTANWYEAIRGVDFTANIRDFMANVKWKKSGMDAYSTGEGSGKTAMQEAFEKAQKQRFSMEEPVEETKTLIAMHNMTEEKLRRTLDLGAWPSPSIAIVKAKDGHNNYGEYSAIFPRETIDPQADSRNHVYGGDAWTPTHDNALVEREVNYAARRAFDSRIEDLSGQFAGGIFHGSSTLGKIGLENETRWEPGEIAEKLANYPEVQAAYLQSKGESLEPERRSKQFDRNYSNATIQRYLGSVGAQEVARLNVKLLTGGHLTEKEAAQAEKAIREVYAEEHANFLNRRPESKEKRIDYYMQNNVTRNRVEDFVRSAEAFYESGGSANELDKEATAAKMFEMIAPGGSWGDALRVVKDWVQPQLDGLLGERGVYNGKDTVTDSGRRSFAETHWDYTAENIVKAMNMASDKGANMYGVTPETLAATATPEFGSVDEMHADEDRLRTEDQDAHDRALRDLGVELDRVVDDLMRTTKHRHSNTFEEEQALSGIIAEAAKGKRTASAVKAAFRKEGYTISDGHAASILHLIGRAASIPTGYYEAKSKRVIPFTESVAVLAPDNAPADLLSEMREAGMNVIEYAAGDDADRLEKINSIKDIRFSAEDAAADGALQRSKEESAEEMRRAREEADEALADRAAEQYRKEKWAENRAERAYIKAERDAKREDAGNVTPVRKATKPVAESKPIDAKNSLRRKMTKLFHIPEGAQKEAGKIIDACADHILKNGALTQEERTRFLNRMYESGIVNTDSLMRAAGQYIAPRRIYVDKKTKAAFGDEWNSFRRRAHAAGLNLLTTEKTKDTSIGIDALGAQLAEQLPTVFSHGKFSEQEMLEHVVQLAEESQAEHMSLSDYIAEVSGKDFIRERQLYNELEREMDHALQTFAETAKLEIKLRDRTGVRLAQEREEFHRQQQEDRARRRERESAEKAKKQAENEEREQRARERAILRQAREQEYRIEAARRKRENRELRELQQKTLKQLQWLSKNRERAPEEVKEAWNDVLGDIDIYAASAANELHWSKKHNATWGDLRDIYLKAKEEDPNFLPSEELEKIVARLDKDKIADMDLDALRDLYNAAVGLRTEFYNRNKVLGDDEFREFNEIYLNAAQEIKDAPKGKERGGKAGELFDALINDQQLSPMNVMQRMGGWNPDGSFYSMAKQLEQGERAVRDYTVKANRLLEDFLNKHQDWVKKADGQGKDAIWYKLEVPELTKLEMGDKPIFGDTVTVYMTPAQKVHLYLESKNYSNLRHMTGGRKFVDRELYSRGKRAEALDKGTTIKLAPETVKKLVSDLTPEEAELARILEQYYNTFAPKEINRVSNVLLGYDKATTKNYAPIYTDQNYTKSEFGVFDVTAEGVGNLKKRKVSTTPSLNISAFDAFEKHVDQTARYTGMAIPTRNMNTLMNWRGESDSMKDVIAREWGGKANQYIKDLVTEMQGEKSEKKTAPDIISEMMFSNYISAVFGFNPSIVLKQLGSIPMGSAYLGTENLPSIKQIRGIDEKLISRYTRELAWRTMGYSMPETKQLKDNPNWTETNKFVNFTFGGGAITAMDGWAASVLWPQAENKVRREHPELEIGTDEQVKNGTSPFYQAVAKEFNDAVARSQSTSDIIHQGTLRRNKNPITRAFTMFKSDSSQTYNAIRQKYGEWQYYKKSGASEETLKKAKKGLGEAVLAALVNAVWSGTVTFAMAALKNGAKRYRDDNDELTAASILKEFGMGLVGDLAGVMTGGEELAEIIGNTLTGEKWYRIETPGLEQLDDLLENTTKKLSSLKEHGGEFLNIMENGGSLSEYMRREGNNLVGWIRDVAKDAATYIPGVPVNNIETYLLGVVRSISPEAAAAYEDAFTRVEKSDLKHTHGRTLKAKTRDLLKDRTGSDRKETADAVAELYDSGYTKALPSATPSSVTIDKVEHKLNAYQTQVYEMAWRKAISGELDEMVQLPVFRRASEEMREKMLDKLYSYASDMAKAAVFDDYEPKTSTQTMSENAKHGLTVAVQIVGEVGKESDPKGLSLPTLGD